MKKFYVVGNKASKSLSPLIFNHWFKKYKIKARYSYLELNNQNFDERIKEILNDNKTRGLNITIPFKQKIIKHVSDLDKHAKEIKAVNCVSIKSKIIGSNTDWEGYYKTLPKLRKINTKNVLIIGYGGAALAIHYVLKKRGFKKIIIVNRTRKKLKFEKNTKYTKSIKKINEFLVEADIVINTTPINLIDKRKTRLIDKNTILSDIVYKPKETAFLRNFPKNKKIYGISMLLEQAISCFNLWFGFKPSSDLKLIKLLDKKIK